MVRVKSLELLGFAGLLTLHFTFGTGRTGYTGAMRVRSPLALGIFLFSAFAYALPGNPVAAPAIPAHQESLSAEEKAPPRINSSDIEKTYRCFIALKLNDDWGFPTALPEEFSVIPPSSLKVGPHKNLTGQVLRIRTKADKKTYELVFETFEVSQIPPSASKDLKALKTISFADLLLEQMRLGKRNNIRKVDGPLELPVANEGPALKEFHEWLAQKITMAKGSGQRFNTSICPERVQLRSSVLLHHQATRKNIGFFEERAIPKNALSNFMGAP